LKKIILLFTLFIPVVLLSQNNYELFPGNLNIQPFVANILEPKVGTLFQLNSEEIRLDIGNSLDIIQFMEDDKTTLSIGADFFTYTLLRGEKEFHFPVDAVDYLFGINFGYKKQIGCNEFGARIRLSHISAHFVDGHFDNRTEGWRNSRSPRVYSREFIELIPYYRINNIRAYLGYTYIFHIDPSFLGKNDFQFGFDYFFNNILSQYFHPFVGYDLKFLKINKYSGNNSIFLGIKIGSYTGNGLSIYYNFYSGKSIHGEYFDYNKTYNAIGFNLDL
jgi:hypothetical protein